MSIFTEYPVATIGVLGTLLGVALSALIDRLRRIGKIKVYVNKVEFSFSKRDKAGGLVTFKEYSKDIEYIRVSLDIDILNTSAYSRKVIRKIRFLYANKDNNDEIQLYDSSTTKNLNGFFLTDKLNYLNLNPKEIKNLKLYLTSSEHIEKISKSKWYLSYERAGRQLCKTRKIRLN